MAKQIINIGTTGNDGTGDSIRASFQKVKSNFDELYLAANLTSGIASALTIGAGLSSTQLTYNGSQAVTISLPVISAVVPGAYTNTNITVDIYGRITSIASGATGGASSSFTSVIRTSNTTASLSVSSGALVVAGGAGISGSLHVGATINGTTIAASVAHTGPIGTDALVSTGKFSTITALADSSFTSTGYLRIPAGNTAQRPNTGQVNGMIRFNTETKQYEGYNTNSSILTKWTSLGTGGTGGTTYDQSLNTTDTVTFVKVTATTFEATATGIPTITSSTNINLTAANAVIVTASPFRLARLTTVQIAALTPVTGDLVYNITLDRFQGYQRTSWVDIAYTGAVQSGVPIQVPTSYRLLFNGVGNVSFSTTDYDGTVRSVTPELNPTTVTNKIVSYAAGSTQFVTMTFANTITVKLVG
jgi:hypothetical protein